MSYIDINGTQTWYTEAGQGEPLLLLHGGAVGSFWWERTGIVEALSSHFRVYCVDRRGHGFTHDPGGPITFDAMADDTIAFVEAIGCGPASMVGHSDGANVLMLLVLRRPDLVRQMVLMSGNFHYTEIGEAPSAEVMAAFRKELLEWYDANSPRSPDAVLDLSRRLRTEWSQSPTLTAADLARIEARTLVMAADDDTIHLEHAIAQYRAIPNGELAILPGTSHLYPAEKPALTNGLILDFLTKPPEATLFPIRRPYRQRTREE